jgi:hypothetical protein
MVTDVCGGGLQLFLVSGAGGPSAQCIRLENKL